MGYYTRYTLTVETPTVKPNYVYDTNVNTVESIITDLRKTCDGAEYALEEDGGSSDTSKRYEHDTDLCAFSKRYPLAVFTLTGEGEDSGDLWRLYVKNGKSHKTKAVLMYEECPYKAGE